MDDYRQGVKHGVIAALLTCAIILGAAFLLKPSAPEQKFGGTTTSDSLYLRGTLTVDGAQTLTGATTHGGATSFAGATTFSATSTFSGDVLGNVARKFNVTMSSATTTPCAVQNTTGASMFLTSIGVIETAYAGAGTVGLTAGTSTSAFVTSTSPFISNLGFANRASEDVVSTTSTLQSAYAILKSGEWLVWKTTTSTNAGKCVATAL